MTLGQRIKKLRIAKKLSQEELGKILHVLKVSISGYKNDTREPSNDSIKKLASYFNVTTDYLLGNTRALDRAPTADVLELKSFLNCNVNVAFGGVTLNNEQKQRIDKILTQVFWDELQKTKAVLMNEQLKDSLVKSLSIMGQPTHSTLPIVLISQSVGFRFCMSH